MTCILCSATKATADLVHVTDRSIVGQVCRSCQQRLTDRELQSHDCCNHCDRDASYALQPEGGPLVEAGTTGSNDVVLSTEQFGVLCDDHFERQT
jgi:hypothetical protein